MLKHIAWHPLLLPSLILEERMSNISPALDVIRAALWKIEKTVGTHKNYQRYEHHVILGYNAKGEDVWENKDFDASPGDLTSIACECAMLDQKCQINMRLLEWVEDKNDLFSIDVPISKLGTVISPSSFLLKGKIAAMKVGLRNYQIRSVYFGRRAEVQVQAVH